MTASRALPARAIESPRIAAWVTPERVTWAIAGLGGAITLWNAVAYPSGAGYA